MQISEIWGANWDTARDIVNGGSLTKGGWYIGATKP